MQFFSRLRRAGAILFIFALTVPTSAQSKAFDLSLMDTSVEACDDFYQYANGNWIRNTLIPPDRSRYGTFDVVRESNENLLRDILETAAKSAKPAVKSGEGREGRR